jgi:hypothetical protein
MTESGGDASRGGRSRERSFAFVVKMLPAYYFYGLVWTLPISVCIVALLAFILLSLLATWY